MSSDRKRWTDLTVREWEHDLLVSRKLAERRSRILPASKVAGSLSRRDPADDAQIFQHLLTSAASGNAVVLGRGRRPSVIKGYLDFPSLAEGEEDEKGRTKHVIWTPGWTHTGNRLKLLAYASVMAGEDAHAMTIKLGQSIIDRALASPRGFTGYLTERFLRHLRAVGDVDPKYAFLVEGSPLHDLHLHGVIQTRIAKSELRHALARVGGETTLRARERQVHTGPIPNARMWIAYIAKAPLVTANAMQYERVKLGLEPRAYGLLGASRVVRAEGKRWYQVARSTGASIN